MSDIVEFLKARLDEDEARAQHALNADLDHLPTVECRCGRRLHLGGDADRTLREVEAKRDLIGLHHPHDHYGEHGDAEFCDECQWDHGGDEPRIDNQPVEGFGANPCRTLAALASVYADHPDYREEWRR